MQCENQSGTSSAIEIKDANLVMTGIRLLAPLAVSLAAFSSAFEASAAQSEERVIVMTATGGDAFEAETAEGEPLTVRLAETRASEEGDSATAARERLTELLGGSGDTAMLAYSGAERDRYDRAIAHVTAEGRERTVQQIMVEEGWLAVASYADNHAAAPELLALEARAREDGRGAWGTGGLTVRDPDPNGLAPHLDSVQIVEGRIVAVGGSRDRTYLNFGTDWRTDFTASIARGDRRRFEDAGINPEDLEGAIVRVRGWLTDQNGPMIELDHPQALEIVDAPEEAEIP